MTSVSPKQKKLTFKDKAYSYIYTRIIRQYYHPGDRIVAQEVADQLNISIAPIREAIMELANNGILEYKSNAGAIVRTISQREINQFMKLRLLIEPFIAGEAAKYATDDDLKIMLQLTQDMRDMIDNFDFSPALDDKEKEKFYVEFNRLDQKFHLRIAKATKNIAFEKISLTLINSLFLNGLKHFELKMNKETYLETLQTHVAILDALYAREDQEASKAMTNSLNYGERRICSNKDFGKE